MPVRACQLWALRTRACLFCFEVLGVLLLRCLLFLWLVWDF